MDTIVELLHVVRLLCMDSDKLLIRTHERRINFSVRVLSKPNKKIYDKNAGQKKGKEGQSMVKSYVLYIVEGCRSLT